MAPIGLMSLLVVAFVLERALGLRRGRVLPTRLVAELGTLASPDGAAIVDAILALAKTLNLRSIAEGIETEDQLRYLARKDCDLLQGFYFARPLYPEDVPDSLRQNYTRQIDQVLAGPQEAIAGR